MKKLQGNVIYAITNTKTGRYYVGRTCNFNKRKRDHFRDLKAGMHKSRKLQASYDKHGAGCFNMVALCHGLGYNDAVKLEQKMLDKHFDTLYNSSRSAKGPNKAGMPLSEEHKKNVSESLRGPKHPHWGKPRSEETKRKIGGPQKGIPKPKVTCPHCGLVGGNGIMQYRHFDNCKHKEN